MWGTTKTLLSGGPAELHALVERAGSRHFLYCSGIILVGAGAYGATVGLWRAPLQAFYTAIKFPLLTFLTCGGNALLNGMLAQLLGSGLTFRQTTLAILSSFAVTALLLGALAPIAVFLTWNTPPLTAGTPVTSHSVILLSHVGLIACAGVVGNRRLLTFLKGEASARIARQTLLGWLTGNLLLGSQLAWVLRPFIGSPGLVVEFFRPDPLRGNFFEAVTHALRHLLF
jgi:hypothetical protein